MSIADKLAQERRARLAAERLLEQKQRELFAANEKLAAHARDLSDQVVQQRQVAKVALTEAQELKGQNSRFLDDLERAHAIAVRAERRLWDSIDSVADGFAIFDAEGRLVTANRAYLSAFGNNHTIEKGSSYDDILQLFVERRIVDFGTVPTQEWRDQMARRWASETLEPVTLRFVNGHYIKMIDRRTPGGDTVSLALDTTEMMRMWAAVETIPDGFVLYDRHDRMVMCNNRYRELYPESAAAMVPGATFEEILRYGLQNGQYMDAIGREEDWLAERLRRHRNPEGTVEQHLGGGRWLRVLERETPDGGRVGLRVDISELKEQQTALEAARLEAESANRAKSAFLANMSHEIRTPMNGVVGMAELLCDTELSEEQRLYAETIKSSGEALLGIINDVLDYSKIEANKLVLRPEAFDLERTIHEIAMMMQPSVQKKGIDFFVDFDMFLPTRFIGDPGRLRQILTNLIGNAIKFTETGHVLVRVVGIEDGPEQWELHLNIEDTGIGIAPEHREHVFGQFNQVEDQSNRKFEGTGLGLAITKRLIEQMGGSIWVESEPGKGSCFGFQITLPIAEDSASGDTIPITLRRALVVDDQLINRTILDRQLRTYGLEVTMCRSGAEAMAALEAAGDYDLLITDHEMPDMNGIDLAIRLRETGRDLPILMLTSNPVNARERFDEAQLTAVLQKPLLRRDLFQRLQALSNPGSVEQAEKPTAERPARLKSDLRQMRILAAEDNRTNQLVFSKMVKDLDIDLVFANNGREAVDLYQSYRPDMIFMDISMPELDGRDAARMIRALEVEGGTKPVPIVALTAHAMDGDREGILAAGIDDYMTKPLRKLTIVDRIYAACPTGVRPPCPPPMDEAV